MAKDFIAEKMKEAAEELKSKFAKGGLLVPKVKVNAGAKLIISVKQMNENLKMFQKVLRGDNS